MKTKRKSNRKVTGTLTQGPIEMDVRAADLLKAVKAVQIAISTEETRYYLCGVFLEVHHSDRTRLHVTATDGHRLVTSSLQSLSGAADTGGSILASDQVRKFCAALRKLGKGNVHLSAGFSTVTLTQGEWSETFRAIDGTYPDWRRVLPNVATLPKVTIKVAALRYALANAKTPGESAPFQTGDGNWHKVVASTAVALSCAPGLPVTATQSGYSIGLDRVEKRRTIIRGKRQGEVEIKVVWNEKLDTIQHHKEWTVECGTVCGPVSKIREGFNARYLHEWFKSTRGDTKVTIHFGSGGPASFDFGDNITRVLMPMRLRL